MLSSAIEIMSDTSTTMSNCYEFVHPVFDLGGDRKDKKTTRRACHSGRISVTGLGIFAMLPELATTSFRRGDVYITR